MLPAQVFALLVHEAGHAFTTKAVGREVLGVGIGWYWYSPIAFVDTTDTWLATRRQRVAVNFAGPYANWVLGSVVALVAHAIPDAVVRAALWQFAFASYTAVLMNLNPLLEYDGYYVLADLMDRPNLRKQALGWLGNGLVPSWGDRTILSKHFFDLSFGLASVFYVVAMSSLTLILYRVFLQGWMAKWIPAALASGLAWILAAAVVVLSAANIVSDLRHDCPKI
jgi:putative peptide zinc metalloprotease protein